MIRNLLFIIFLSLLIVTTPVSLSQAGNATKFALELGSGDIVKGTNHLTKLSNEGNSTATFVLAQLLLEAKKIESARRLLIKSSELDHPIAMKFLATGYFKGAFGKIDYKKAKYWFEKSAKSRNINAMVFLGFIYRDGLGVSKDLKTAYRWFTIAGILKPNDSRHKEPEDFADELKPSLTSSNIEDANRVANNWLSQHPQKANKIPGIPRIQSAKPNSD